MMLCFVCALRSDAGMRDAARERELGHGLVELGKEKPRQETIACGLAAVRPMTAREGRKRTAGFSVPKTKN